VLFLGSLYAGHRTRFENLRAHTEDDGRIAADYRTVGGWVEGGAIERLPVLGAAVKGRLRALREASAFASWPRPDAIWSSVATAVLPFTWAQLGPLRRPLVLDLDETLDLRERYARPYYGREPRGGAHARLLRAQERALYRGVTLFTPWSKFTADSLRASGIAEERIRVLPPGVDLELWRPPAGPRVAGAGPLRLLFVGGDFVRKGGDLLLEAIGGPLAGRCRLDVVTREPVPATPGVQVHHAEPNSPALRGLYASAELFVLPSRVEFFGIAAIEALASGLPAIVSSAGAGREIVDPGATGWVVEPTAAAVAAAIEAALSARSDLLAMGRRARAVAEARYDGRANDRAVVDVILDAIEAFGART
jgi:glycosyltransferase involved in cell wall biosynthesis